MRSRITAEGSVSVCSARSFKKAYPLSHKVELTGFDNLFDITRPSLTEQFDLFELEDHGFDSHAVGERIRPTEKRLSAEFQEQSLVL